MAKEADAATSGHALVRSAHYVKLEQLGVASLESFRFHALLLAGRPPGRCHRQRPPPWALNFGQNEPE